jgi:hypothetical protein
MGLIRKALVVGGLFLVLPSPPAPQEADGQPGMQSSTFAAITAAADTFADFKGFCERRPQACVTGQYLAASLEGKARYGARLIYEWANPHAAQDAQQAAAILPLAKPDAKAKPQLRLATLNNSTPKSIEDLLHVTAE